ncbi:MAG: hypothetical protein A2W23_00935 [Planctomycetes bacterium RBG_16_43_13]|nr:MAG: hypothetical protein A2W23_00935 [Planctomycetes bacterium RBG_16_43_13]
MELYRLIPEILPYLIVSALGVLIYLAILSLVHIQLYLISRVERQENAKIRMLQELAKVGQPPPKQPQ